MISADSFVVLITLYAEFKSSVVPYISEPYTSTEGMYKERLSAEEVYKKIEADLLDIVGILAITKLAREIPL